MTKFRTILADPPWQQPMMGRRLRKKHGNQPQALPYPTMTLEQIATLPVRHMAEEGCHLWLWTTNAFLRSGFDVMAAWGFKFLAPIHWIKPSGCGNYVIHRSQSLLLGYFGKCRFDRKRYFPNVLATGNPASHSVKPDAFFELIEQVSHGPRLELFARERREGWSAWGNEVDSDLEIGACLAVRQNAVSELPGGKALGKGKTGQLYSWGWPVPSAAETDPCRR